MTNRNLVFDHVTTLLNFDDSLSREKHFLFAKKDILSDLSFIFADILSFYLKKEYPVIIVNLAQSFHHYNQITMKSGINMKLLREKRKVISIDTFAEAERLINASLDDIENLQTLSSVVSDSTNVLCLKPLSDLIQTSAQNFTKSKPERFLILIDEINVLINLGISMRAIQSFVQSCYSFCVNGTDASGMLLMGCLHDMTDIESLKIVNYFSHICDIELHIDGLLTGFSKDVQGKIYFETKDKATGNSEKRKLFFKVEDKGAKFFADGL